MNEKDAEGDDGSKEREDERFADRKHAKAGQAHLLFSPHVTYDRLPMSVALVDLCQRLREPLVREVDQLSMQVEDMQ